MYCTKCGKEIEPRNTFCTNCGASVKSPAASPAPVAGAPTPAPRGGRKVKLVILVLVVVVSLTLVPVVPVPKTHILYFSVPTSGTLRPNAYVSGSVSHLGGTNVDAIWNSSAALTGFIFTQDQYANFRNVFYNNATGQATPLTVATSSHGNLFLRELPYSQVLYFVLWNRSNTNVTFHGVSAFTIWREGECYFTVLNYLSETHSCFA